MSPRQAATARPDDDKRHDKQFLVTGTWLQPATALSPEQVIQLREQTILPSLELIALWETQGKITGGVLAGEQGVAFVMDAAAPAEASHTLRSLPFADLLQWQIQPLQTMQSTVEREREVIAQSKAALRGGRQD